MKSKYLEYEKCDAIGNIRLKHPVSKTGGKIGDRIVMSPGNGNIPVTLRGTIRGNDGDMVIVTWIDGVVSSVNKDFIQLVNIL